MYQPPLESNNCHICHIHSTYTHSHTFNTFSDVQDFLNSHEKHALSLKRWKAGESAGLQARQLVAGQIKKPKLKTSRESDNRQSCTLRQANKIKANIHTNTHLYVCFYEKQRVRQPDVVYTQRRKETKNKSKEMFTHTHLYVCLYVWLHEERERICVTLVTTAALKGVWVISTCVRACVLTTVVRAHKSGQTKNRYVHAH
jgi:hypothetical protein